jgi:C4-dicarboxylate-specific signal transduction histidine kinase
MAQETTEGEFSLFDQEERALQSAASMIGMLEEVAGGVRELAEAYKQGYREQRRILRISDRLQLDLHQANQTLATQSDELQHLKTTLKTEIRLREALAEDLRLFNENLEQRVKEEVAKRREHEHLLIQQSRHAAMGEMIGNITHQWRQPLFALSMIVQRIAHEFQEKVDTPNKLALADQVAKADNVIRQMSGTIDDFRDFFKPSKNRELFRLLKTVESTLHLVNSSLGCNIQVHDESAVAIQVSGFPNELSQALLNVLTNAKEAILERKLDEKNIDIYFGQDEENAWISVQDHAGGVPKDILPNVFDPYFTTKEKGTGIGLYMSKIIMKNMGGAIEARNLKDGAEFRLILPKAPARGDNPQR